MSKIYSFVFLCMLCLHSMYSQDIEFPQSFVAGNLFFPNMKLIEEKTSESNPIYTTNKQVINSFVYGFDYNYVNELYGEFYTDSQANEAGVLVYQIDNPDHFEHILTEDIEQQKDHIWLNVQNKYLITIWCYNYKTKNHVFEQLTNYYVKNLNATLLFTTIEETIIEHTTVPEYNPSFSYKGYNNYLLKNINLKEVNITSKQVAILNQKLKNLYRSSGIDINLKTCDSCNELDYIIGASKVCIAFNTSTPTTYHYMTPLLYKLMGNKIEQLIQNFKDNYYKNELFYNLKTLISAIQTNSLKLTAKQIITLKQNKINKKEIHN